MGNGAPNSNGAYQAIVPPGGYAGRSMTTVVNGQSVTVKIPPGVSAGQVFSFQLSDCTFNNSPTHGAGEQYAPGHPLAHRNEAQSPAAQGNATYSVIVPHGIQPGQSFQVNVNGQNLMVKCPQNAYPGSSIVIKVPTPGPVNYSGPPPSAAPMNYQAPGTTGSAFSSYPGNSVPTTTSAMSSHSPNGNNSAGKQKFNVTIPPNVFPNQKFQANCNGVMVNVTCPLTGYPGQTITIEIPATTTPPPSATTQHHQHQQHSPVNHSAYPHTHSPPPAVGGNKRVQVLIPQGGYPGAQMDINVDGLKLRITIPPNAVPGQTITVEVPSSTTPAPAPVTTAPTPYGYGNGESRSAVPYGLSDPNALPVQSQQETYRVTVPMDVRPGQVFEATVGGQKMRITCPPNASSGMILTIQGPSAPAAPQHDTYHSNNYQNNQPPPLAVAEPYNANSDGYDLPVAALISDSTTATTVYSGDGSSVLYSADGTTAGSGNNYVTRSPYPAVMTAPASSTTNNTNNSTYTNHFSNSSAPPAFNPSAVNMVRDEY